MSNQTWWGWDWVTFTCPFPPGPFHDSGITFPAEVQPRATPWTPSQALSHHTTSRTAHPRAHTHTQIYFSIGHRDLLPTDPRRGCESLERWVGFGLSWIFFSPLFSLSGWIRIWDEASMRKWGRPCRCCPGKLRFPHQVGSGAPRSRDGD